MNAANESNCTVILANDPDSDRMALAEKQPRWAENLTPLLQAY